MNESVRRLSFGPMLAFGIGQTAEGIKNTAFNTFLLFYYQQVVGVSGTLTGLALAIALCFDAVTDPLAGAVSDRTQTRWGRRHPFLLIASVPLAICFYLLFNPLAEVSEFASFVWLTVFAILVRGALTFYNIPHLALGAEMARDYNQRSTLFAFSTLFGILGGAFTGFFAYRLFFPTTPEFSPGLLNPDGYSGFGLVFGIAMALAILTCFLGTFREIPHLRQPMGVQSFKVGRMVRDLVEAFRNRSFRALFFGMLFSTLVLSVEGVFSPYMGVHFWGLTTEQLSLIPLVILVAVVLSLPLTPLVTRRLDKKLAVIAPAFIVIINANVLIVLRLLDVPWFPSNESMWILPLVMMTTFVSALLAPVVFTSINSMFADIADEHEIETGERREGVIYSARAFVLKSTGALGIFLGGILLDVIAFPRGAAAGTVADETVWILGFIQGPATSVFTLIGLVLYMGYKLDRKRHAEIMAELDRRRQVAALALDGDRAAEQKS
jgi:glycoside/pentoside/hexuronide:cation symporter, GPH family